MKKIIKKYHQFLESIQNNTDVKTESSKATLYKIRNYKEGQEKIKYCNFPNELAEYWGVFDKDTAYYWLKERYIAMSTIFLLIDNENNKGFVIISNGEDDATIEAQDDEYNHVDVDQLLDSYGILIDFIYDNSDRNISDDEIKEIMNMIFSQETLEITRGLEITEIDYDYYGQHNILPIEWITEYLDKDNYQLKTFKGQHIIFNAVQDGKLPLFMNNITVEGSLFINDDLESFDNFPSKVTGLFDLSKLRGWVPTEEEIKILNNISSNLKLPE